MICWVQQVVARLRGGAEVSPPRSTRRRQAACWRWRRRYNAYQARMCQRLRELRAMIVARHLSKITLPLPEGSRIAETQAADAASRLAEGEDPDAAQLPPGTVAFNLGQDQLSSTLAKESVAVEAAPDIDVPDALLPPERLDELLAERQPAFVPLQRAAAVRV